jgi:hypothetical protein
VVDEPSCVTLTCEFSWKWTILIRRIELDGVADESDPTRVGLSCVASRVCGVGTAVSGCMHKESEQTDIHTRPHGH